MQWAIVTSSSPASGDSGRRDRRRQQCLFFLDSDGVDHDSGKSMNFQIRATIDARRSVIRPPLFISLPSDQIDDAIPKSSSRAAVSQWQTSRDWRQQQLPSSFFRSDVPPIGHDKSPLFSRSPLRNLADHHSSVRSA
ncbi:hypothetical protein ACLOJK_007419, partial [Asimina triloba]